jgi:hypothetical protein
MILVTDATAIEAEEDGVVYIRGKRTRQVRDWITIKEFHELARKSVAQVSRWVAGKHLPHPDGDPRNPWPSDEVRWSRSARGAGCCESRGSPPPT